jgi:prolyl-tRNA editing enzyme YbaK/EbsC (Cys-tRNA(Pro) deacylase)
MKKNYPGFIDESCQYQDYIFILAGICKLQPEIAPDYLTKKQGTLLD